MYIFLILSYFFLQCKDFIDADDCEAAARSGKKRGAGPLDFLPGKMLTNRFFCDIIIPVAEMLV